MQFKSIFVTGGAGYCGSLLVPQLLARGYQVTVYDIMYFGNDFLPVNNPKLKLVAGDIRDTPKLEAACRNHDAFVSLACISNDASTAHAVLAACTDSFPMKFLGHSKP